MVKLSHSGMNRYITCAKSYELRYIDKLVSKHKGSSLFFGSAIDSALNYMLEYKDSPSVVQDAVGIFNREWFQQKDNKYELIELPKNTDIIYLKSDYNADLLQKEDWETLATTPEALDDIRNYVESTKKDLGWTHVDEKSKITYNHANWLCLSRKAKLFIQAYYDQLLPNIKRTVAVQIEVNLFDGNEGALTGFVDAVVELHDGRVIVLDNKTSSMKYSEDSVKNSNQLSLYESILNVSDQDPSHPWKTPIDACGYAVMNKKLKKTTTKVCVDCGHTVTTSHTSCNAMTGEGKKKRCGGAFNETVSFTVPTQFLVDIIPEKLHNEVLDNAEIIIANIKAKYFPQNFDACNGIYGQCEFFKLCHEGSLEGLIDMKDRKKDGEKG